MTEAPRQGRTEPRSPRGDPAADGASWSLSRTGGLLVATCAPLRGIRGVLHGISTRAGEGGHAFDLGPADAREPEVLGRRRSFLEACGLGRREARILKQVHGARLVPASSPTGAPPEADGSYWVEGDDPRWVPAVRTADCVPLLLADRGGRGVAAVHAGWRGAALGIARAAVERLAALGLDPGDLIAALGPAIGPCCYEVGGDVADAVLAASGGAGAAAAPGTAEGKSRLDLRKALGAQLLESGVPETSIHVAPWCTCCAADLFFSYRRDGIRAGRLMAVVGIVPPGAP